MSHSITVTNYDGGVRVTCTCGWIDRWSVADGSAQQSGDAHVHRAEAKEQQA